MLTAHYAGSMRGGQTEATVVLREERIQGIPPILPSASSALVMHDAHWPPVRDRLRPASLVVVEESLFDLEQAAPDSTTIAIPAMATAEELGVPLAATFVLLAAYNEIAELVSVDSLVAVMAKLLPPYRSQHIDDNERGLRAGSELGKRERVA